MRAELKYIMKIALAVLVLAVSINMFLGPHHIAAGGVSGIGILFEAMVGINRAWIVLGCNFFLLILAALFLDRKDFLNTVYGSLMFLIVLRLVPEIKVTNDRLLAVIFGSIIFALGVAALYQIRASSGGTTIPPLIFKKYFGLNTAVGLFLIDTTVVCVSLFVFGFDEFLFAILSLGITSIVMTYVETGLNRKKAVLLVTAIPTDQIKARILLEGFKETVFGICEGQENKDKRMIFMVVNDQQYPRLKEIVQRIDAHSQMMVYNVAEVQGLNFTYHPIQ